MNIEQIKVELKVKLICNFDTYYKYIILTSGVGLRLLPKQIGNKTKIIPKVFIMTQIVVQYYVEVRTYFNFVIYIPLIF